MMYTAIIDRPERHEMGWRGDIMSTAYERREIVYCEDLNRFIALVKTQADKFAADIVDKDAYCPEFILLIGGVPYDEIENIPAGLPSPPDFEHYTDSVAKELKTEKARQANDARLEKERKEKRDREFAEKLQYEKLRKKYGN